MKYARDVGKIWFVERNDSGWSEPYILDRQANKDLMGISSTLDGTLYSSGIVRIGQDNSHYLEPEWLGPPLDVMTPGGEHVGHPFIAPDESYIIFEDKRTSGHGWALYLSFHLSGDRWSPPINLADRMKFSRNQSLPMVTPDGKYVFFTSGKSIYWVSAKFIEELRP